METVCVIAYRRACFCLRRQQTSAATTANALWETSADASDDMPGLIDAYSSSDDDDLDRMPPLIDEHGTGLQDSLDDDEDEMPGLIALYDRSSGWYADRRATSGHTPSSGALGSEVRSEQNPPVEQQHSAGSLL